MSTNYDKLVRCSQEQIDIFIQSLVTKDASRYVDWSAWLSSENPNAPMKGEPAFLMEDGTEKDCRMLAEYVENERTFRRIYILNQDGTVREEAFPVHMVRKASEEYYPAEEEPEDIPEFSMADIFPDEEEETEAEAPAEEPAPIEEKQSEEAPAEEPAASEEEPEEEDNTPLELPKAAVKTPSIEKTRIYVPGERLWMDDDEEEEAEEEEKEEELPAEEPAVTEEEQPEEAPAEEPLSEEETTPEEEPAPAEKPDEDEEDDEEDALQSLLKELESMDTKPDEDILTEEDTAHILAIEDELMRNYDTKDTDVTDDTSSSADIRDLLENLKEKSDLYDPDDPEDRELPTIAFTSMVDDKTRF